MIANYGIYALSGFSQKHITHESEKKIGLLVAYVNNEGKFLK